MGTFTQRQLKLLNFAVLPFKMLVVSLQIQLPICTHIEINTKCQGVLTELLIFSQVHT